MPSLYKHQKEIIDAAPKRYGIFTEVGTGKTAIALTLAKKNKQVPLIICPKSLTKNWERECKMWGVEYYRIITKETFRRDWEKLPRYNFIIYDELHTLLGFKSQMHKNAAKYSKKHQPEYIYGLTGTVFLSTPWNVYCAEKLLGFMPSYPNYLNTFFNQVRMGRRTIPVPIKSKYPLLIEIINRIGVTKRLDEVIDIPDSVYLREDFETNEEQRKAMRALEDVEPLPYYSKCFQIENGTQKSDGFSKNKFYKSEKFDRALQIIDETKKIIVVCRHTLEIEKFAKEIKDKKVYVITGKTENRQEIFDAANEAQNCVLIINASICEGFNLPGFKTMMFYSMSWSIKDRIQMEGRIRRVNNPQKCVYINMVVSGGVDSAVYKNIMAKKDFNVLIYAERGINC